VRTQTLKSMRNRAAHRASIPTPTALTATSIDDANAAVNEGAAEFHRLVVEAAGDTAYRKPITLRTVAGQFVYPLPQDFYEIVSVSILLDNAGTDRRYLTRFTLAERPYLMSSTPGWAGESFKYMIVGKGAIDGSDTGAVELLPIPSSVLAVELLYVFGPPLLVQDGDALDGFAGMEDYVITFAMRRFAESEENYDLYDRASTELDRIKADVLANMRNRDASQCPRVSMTRDAWGPRAMRGSRFR
jgi:hypothetical protein